MALRPPTGSIPELPGSYQFFDADGRVIYVGKAKSLRSRLNSYFQDPGGLPYRTAQMVDQADHVEWMVVNSEAEALVLEHSLIQRFQPRYNVRLKDDKSYPWLAISVDDQWPRPAIVRGRKRKGVRYFGPYPNVGAIRETLDLLLRSFPLRTCSDTKFRNHVRLGRPCLLFHIDRCSGPCVNEISHEEYDGMVADFVTFLGGDTGPLEKELTAAMQQAASAQEYERASQLRDKLSAIRAADAVRQMELDRPEDLDVVAWFGDELETAIQVFHVRSGKVVGRQSSLLERVEDLADSELLSRVLVDLYADPPSGVPRAVLVPVEPSGREAVEDFLAGRRGGPVEVRVPQRGPKRDLMDTVEKNAREVFQRHRLQRTADHNSRARALQSLQEALDLPMAPLRIECFDMSHLQGTDYVGSMVVFEDGLPRKSEYRHFRVSTVDGNDDYAAMEEVLTRRLMALMEDSPEYGSRPSGAEAPANDDGQVDDGQVDDGQVDDGQVDEGSDGPPEGGDGPLSSGEPPARRRRFAYPPQLILIDGGLGQLNVVVDVVARLGLTDRVPLASLAKSFEEVYRPGSSTPIRLPRQSEALYLLQRLRDEAHRFAISYHRSLRGKRMTIGALDGIPGLGPKRRERLVATFDGLPGLRKAPKEVLLALSWLPDEVAEAVYERVHNPLPAPGRLNGVALKAAPSAGEEFLDE